MHNNSYKIKTLNYIGTYNYTQTVKPINYSQPIGNAYRYIWILSEQVGKKQIYWILQVQVILVDLILNYTNVTRVYIICKSTNLRLAIGILLFHNKQVSNIVVRFFRIINYYYQPTYLPIYQIINQSFQELFLIYEIAYYLLQIIRNAIIITMSDVGGTSYCFCNHILNYECGVDIYVIPKWNTCMMDNVGNRSTNTKTLCIYMATS